MGALSDCFFRLQDIYQPQGGEPHPRFIAPAHAVGSRIDCLDPRFGSRAVVPLTRDNPDHSGCEGVRPVFCLMNDRPFALKPVISEMAPTSGPLKTGVLSCLINLITWISNFKQEIKSNQHWAL